MVRAGGLDALITLDAWVQGLWLPLALKRADDGWGASAGGVRIFFKIGMSGADFAWSVALESEILTRVRLKVGKPGVRGAFHIIPCCLFGDNNLAGAEPGHFPNLTAANPGNPSCSTYWEFRADRASLPVSMLCFEGGIAAVSIDPYSPADPAVSTSREGFIRNGIFAQLADGRAPAGCGVTLGYRNTPRSFINKDQWGVPTEHLATHAAASGRIMLRSGNGRRLVHDVIQTVYDLHRECPEPRLDPHDAVRDLVDVFLQVSWREELKNFTNLDMRDDPRRRTLKPWRTLAEIGWTGGGVIGYPLLIAGQMLDDGTALARGREVFDRIAGAWNPASGLLWDVCGPREGRQVDWWWSGYLVQGVHCAYTNASGLYYLLKAYQAIRGWNGSPPREWLETACRALDTICRLQSDDGSFGYTYSPDRPAVMDSTGFAGSWFIPALALAHRVTGSAHYLDAARRGIEFYARDVESLCCCGTPMDTWKSPEQEGNLGFIRGAQLLHAITGEDRFLEVLADGAAYEFLWRYGFRARPEYAPLKGSPWNSCGGSVTSVSNPHIHPMACFVQRELAYLSKRSGVDYHRRRWEDGIHWTLNTISMYPEVSGYGRRGILTERWCPSDGLTIERLADGSPSSLWYSFNGWAAAAALEGLTEWLEDGQSANGVSG